MEILIKSGVKIRPNTTIGADLIIDDLFRDGFRAIFMGTGVWRPRRLNIKGESLGHVHFAINYLHNPDAYCLGKRVAIIGAGNVAMDVARTAFRNGCESVTILCRMGEASVTARDSEVKYTKMDGARFLYYKIPVEITENGILLQDAEAFERDDGKKAVRPIVDTEELFSCDFVIIAISQGPKATVLLPVGTLFQRLCLSG